MKIVLVIEPNYTLKKNILMWKNKFFNSLGSQIYLSHPPHMTIFSMNVSKKLIGYLDSKDNFFFNNDKFKNLFIHINKCSYFFPDPTTKGLTIYYTINKNKKLFELQKMLINEFKKFKLNRLKNIDFKNHQLNIQYVKYGYPFIGNNWLPHMTILSVSKKHQDNKIIKKFLNQKKINFIQKVNKVSIWSIDNERHTKIKDIITK